MKSLALVVACWFALARGGIADEGPPAQAVPFDGTEAFGHLLHSFDLEPIGHIDRLAQLPPERTLIIVFGDWGKITFPDRGLKGFRDKGGAVLLASDYPPTKSLHTGWSAVTGTKVRATGRSIYQGNWPECPVVKNWTDPAHPLFKDLHRGLATNRPSYLRTNELGLARLAEYEDDCKQDLAGFPPLPNGAAYILGSPKDASPDSRMVILAGHGLFLNGMLIQNDNDNFAFAWNTISWLSQSRQGRRQYAAFIVNGKLVDNFALPLGKFGELPIPPIQVINRVIRGLEDENIFNRMLVESGGKGPYLRALFLVASLAVLIWGAWRLMQGRYQIERDAILVLGKHQPVPALVDVLEQRREDLRRDGNFWEPAQVLARQFFLDYSDLSVPLWDDGPPMRLPLEASGSFWQRRKLKRLAGKIWDLARSSPIRRVSAPRFEELCRQIDELVEALADGRARFV